MEGLMHTRTYPKPHPNYLENLFSHKSHVDHIFKDVLGLYDIHHLAVTHINEKQELMTFSSTPSLEYNLFNSQLWQFDKTYHPDWYYQCKHAHWQSLYMPERYDELYYLKQTKPQYEDGISLATNLGHAFAIYSFARQKNSHDQWPISNQQLSHFHAIGTYCSNALQSLFHGD
jgi:hypothetical protein